jgi:hypothetical protein
MRLWWFVVLLNGACATSFQPPASVRATMPHTAYSEGQFYSDRVRPQIGSLAHALPRLNFEVHNLQGVAYVTVEGRIAAGDAARFAAFYDGLRGMRPPVVLLNSGGGSLLEGVLLGRLFRRVGLWTVLTNGSACHSACALAFLGGVERIIDARAQYGVHWVSGIRQPDPRDTFEISVRVISLLNEYANDMIGDTSVINAMANTLSGDIRVLSSAELEAWHVTTRSI